MIDVRRTGPAEPVRPRAPGTAGPAYVRWVLAFLPLCLAAAAGAACERPESVDMEPGGPATAAVDSMPVAPADAPTDPPTSNAPAEGTLLTIYFSRGESVVAVSRHAPAGGASLDAALRQLLGGPSESERAAGIHSWFSDTTAGALRSAAVDQAGRAVVDFADLRELIPNASTSAGSALLLGELNATVFELPSVRTVEYRIEGSCQAFWEWLQYECQVVARP
jgi:spore germination protein GerM